MTRTVKSRYYAGSSAMSNVVKTTSSASAYNAVPNAVRRMQTNEYAAFLCEVYDEADGALHAVLRRGVQGDIHILYKREVLR